MRPITFMSDFGSDDEFAGVCRAVIARIAPDARVIDLTHGIAPLHIAQGALVLANALGYCAPGVHLAVVDPGVGSSRRALALRTAGEERYLVGPDNGLLWPAAERFGGVAEAVDISASPVRLEPFSATFHGRDLFAPAAAHIARGTPIAALGEGFDPSELATLSLPEPKIDSGWITATVSHSDRFGNLALVLDPGQLESLGIATGAAATVDAGGESNDAVYAATIAEVPAAGLLLYPNASGRISLAVHGASAAARLGIGAGDEIRIAVAPTPSAA